MMDNAMARRTSQTQKASMITCKMPGSIVPIVALPSWRCAISSHTRKVAIKPASAGKGIAAVYFFKLIVVMMFLIMFYYSC